MRAVYGKVEPFGGVWSLMDGAQAVYSTEVPSTEVVS